MTEKNQLMDDALEQVSGGTTAAKGEPKYGVGDYIRFYDLMGAKRKGYITKYHRDGDYFTVVDKRGREFPVALNFIIEVLTVEYEGGACGGW